MSAWQWGDCCGGRNIAKLYEHKGSIEQAVNFLRIPPIRTHSDGMYSAQCTWMYFMHHCQSSSPLICSEQLVQCSGSALEYVISLSQAVAECLRIKPLDPKVYAWLTLTHAIDCSLSLESSAE